MNSTNNCSNNISEQCNNTDSLIQTEVSRLDVMQDAYESSPGENVQVSLNVFDERNSSTIAFLKIDYVDYEDNTTKVRTSCINSCNHGFFYNHRVVK